MAHNIANPLPASFLRGGTSKGVFLRRSDLPADPKDWEPILLGIMGSPDPEHGRQLDGMGGGVSSLSKVCVVGPPTDAQRAQRIDCVYTFVQVGIRDAVLDFSGNCGNLSSMIGVFALDEGICKVSSAGPQGGIFRLDTKSGLATVRSLNTNTNKIIDTTFPVIAAPAGGITPVLDLHQAAVAGVPGKASQILLDFVDPAGARTGSLLPSGAPVDHIAVDVAGGTAAPVRVSLVDATNPTVFVAQADLRRALRTPGTLPIDYGAAAVRGAMESVRRRGAALMGLDPAAQAQPKVAALGAPARADAGADVVVHAFSMGVLHRAVPMTVGLCLGVASGVNGSLAADIVRAARQGRQGAPAGGELVAIRHPGGIVEVGASFDKDGNVQSAKVVRTGRRLMKGVVWW